MKFLTISTIAKKLLPCDTLVMVNWRIFNVDLIRIRMAVYAMRRLRKKS